jgi:hypothetical protein
MGPAPGSSEWLRLIGVHVPSSVLADSVGTSNSSGAVVPVVLDATLVTFSSDIYASFNTTDEYSKTESPSSAPVVSFTLYDGNAAQNGAGASPLRIQKLNTPVMISIPRGPNELNRSDTQCQFWDTVRACIISHTGFFS